MIKKSYKIITFYLELKTKLNTRTFNVKQNKKNYNKKLQNRCLRGKTSCWSSIIVLNCVCIGAYMVMPCTGALAYGIYNIMVKLHYKILLWKHRIVNYFQEKKNTCYLLL
jgi:hypothetical protein